ncbi:MAG: S41 family peptidase [Vicinamibacterales bacterium]
MIRWRRLACVLVAVAAAWPAIAQGPAFVDTFDAAWTIVRDTHFDPKMNGVDWDAVRTELRPRALAATTPGELRAVIREMLGRLGQSHFALLPSSADSPRQVPVDAGGDTGFEVRLSGRDLLVTSVDPTGGGGAAGVKPGWILRTVDGTELSTVLGALDQGLPPRLMNVEAWRAAENRLRGPAGSSVRLGFDTGGDRPTVVPVTRQAEVGEPVTIGNLPTFHVRVESERRATPGGHTAGLVRFNVWMPAVDARFQRAIDELRDTSGVVLDLRGNPGGLAAMMMGISGHFLAERIPLGVMKTRDAELKFAANPRLVNAKGERVTPFRGPLAILVDAMSGSATECFAGGMQSIGRARVFGQTSMGQALPALFDRLPNGDMMIHAYGDFVTADGTRLEGRGVVPDQPVPLDRAALLAGHDATLDAALAWIDQGKPGPD